MSGEERREARTTYHALDALRGVAAIMVMLYHTGYWWRYPPAVSGYLAVDIFFVLSGFVIAHSYDERLSNRLTTARFAVMRVVRFWPLYALGLSIGLSYEIGLIATHNSFAQSPGTVAASAVLGLLFLPTLFHTRFDGTFPFNNVSWSLFFELVINILYAAMFKFLKRSVLTAVVIISGVLLAYVIWIKGSANIGINRFQIPSGLLRTTFSFSFGVLIFRSGFRMSPIPLWTLALVLVAMLAAPAPTEWRALYDATAILVISPLLVIAGASCRPSERAKWFATVIGSISFAVYAIHRPLILFADMATRKMAWATSLMPPLFVVGILLLSFGLDRFFDRPIRRWMSARLGLTNEPKPREMSAP